MKNNENKFVLITECSSGIGSCIVLGLKERGYTVLATCRKQEDIKDLANQGFKEVVPKSRAVL